MDSKQSKKQKEKTNGMKLEGPDINSQSNSKDTKNTHWSKDNLFKKWRMKRMSDLYLLPFIKIKWIRNYHMRLIFLTAQGKHTANILRRRHHSLNRTPVTQEQQTNWSREIKKAFACQMKKVTRGRDSLQNGRRSFLDTHPTCSY